MRSQAVYPDVQNILFTKKVSMWAFLSLLPCYLCQPKSNRKLGSSLFQYTKLDEKNVQYLKTRRNSDKKMSSGIQLVELTIRMAENIGLNYDEKVDYSLRQAFKMVPLDRFLNVKNRLAAPSAWVWRSYWVNLYLRLEGLLAYFSVCHWLIFSCVEQEIFII